MSSQDDNSQNQHREETVLAYDDIFYEGFAYPQTHPNCLAALAILYGMSPAPIAHCRMLELGSGDGSNLIGIASELPHSQFVGIDLSINEVKHAQEKINALNLSNIKINHADIMDVNEDFGQFDYIIAHGVYSWVPEEVRKKVLSICRDRLAPNGVAYVSYNTYPGWHLHGLLREMMLYHVRDGQVNAAAVKKAREFFTLLAETTPQINPVYGSLVKSELERSRLWSDSFFRHDTLGDINQPFYFREFAKAAEKEKLQFLAEADFHSMVPTKFPEKAIAFLQQYEADIIEKEQYLDFFRGRLFRETLLCHQNIKLSRKINLDVFKQFYTAASFPIEPKSSSPDIPSEKVEEFNTAEGVVVSSSTPAAKAVLLCLAENWPRPISFSQLEEQVKNKLGSSSPYVMWQGKPTDLAQLLLKQIYQNFTTGLLKLYLHSPSVSSKISERPMTTPLIRYEAKSRLVVTNPFHHTVQIDNVSHHLLPHLNGENTIDDLIEILVKLVDIGKITLQKSGLKIKDPEQIRKTLREQLDTLLIRFAKNGLLIN